MSRILFARLAIYDRKKKASDPQGGEIQLEPFKAVVQVSVTLGSDLQEPDDRQTLPPAAKPMLALIDSGHNQNLSIREEQMERTGLGPALWYFNDKRPLSVKDASGIPYPVKRILVDVWLHSTLPEWKNHPYRIELKQRGAAFYPRGGKVPGPDLPILGLAALCAGRLRVDFDLREHGGDVLIYVPDSHRAGTASLVAQATAVRNSPSPPDQPQ